MGVLRETGDAGLAGRPGGLVTGPRGWQDLKRRFNDEHRCHVSFLNMRSASRDYALSG